MKYSLYILVFFCSLASSIYARTKEDSLLIKYKATKIDTEKFDIAVKLYNSYAKKGEYEMAKVFVDSLRKLESIINKDKFTCLAYQYRGNYFYKVNKFDSAQYYDLKGIEIADKIKYYPALLKCYVNLGNIYHQHSEFAKSIVALQKAEQFAIREKDTMGRIIVTLNQGNIFYEINDYKQAKANFSKVISICKDLPKFKYELANGYNNLATVYLNETPKQTDSAMYYYKAFLEMSRELGATNSVALAYYNIAEVQRLTGKVKEARDNYFKSKEIYIEEEDTMGLMKVSLGLGDNYVLENKPAEGIVVLKEGLKYSYAYDMVSNASNFLKSLSAAYYKMGNYKEAIDYFKKGSILSDSIYNADNSKILYDLQTRYETTEKDKQNKLLEAENTISHKTIRQQQLVTYFIIGGLILAIAFGFFIFRGLRQQRKANAIISEQKEEVHRQKEIIEEKQKEILDSIHYAKRIQDTLLTNKEIIVSHFADSFIFFRPKDIVSGDFYWTLQKGNSFYLAVCDSTGHGVPGAFMSLLNINFMNEAINEKDIKEPNKVFDYVRDRLIESIGKDGQKDGFDGILLRINKDTKEITYAAANNAPILISEGNLTELPNDRMPVGKGEKQADFTLYDLKHKANEILYLYTDGFADQFGGPKGKKFKYKALNDLLLGCSSREFERQAEELSAFFDDWKGKLEQVDDVCIIGIKI